MTEDSPISAAIKAALRYFQVAGELTSVAREGHGHIHDSYCVVFDRSGALERFLLQKVNTGIFSRTAELMENIERVTAHIAACVRDKADGARRVSRLARALDGRSWHVDSDGGFWRIYRFVEGTRSVDAAESPEQ